MNREFPQVTPPANVPLEVQDYMYRVFEELNRFFANAILIEKIDEIPAKSQDGDIVFADQALGTPPFTGAGVFAKVSGAWTKL